MIPLFYPWIGFEARDRIDHTLSKGWVGANGTAVREFEDEVAQACNVNWAIATVTGTAALHLALHASGVGRNTIVNMPTLTFVGTANAALYLGANLNLFDGINRQDPDQWSPDIRALSWGLDGDCVVDAAPAIGQDLSKFRLSTLSFNANKPVTTGQGGAILGTVEDDYYEIKRMLSLCKIGDTYDCDGLGFNVGMAAVNAAIGYPQVRHIQSILSARAEVMQRYRDAGLVILPSTWTAVWRLPAGPGNREIAEKLRRAGIGARPFWHPLHLMAHTQRARFPVYSNDRHLAVSATIHDRLLMIPCYYGLTNKDQDKVIEECVKYL